VDYGECEYEMHFAESEAETQLGRGGVLSDGLYRPFVISLSMIVYYSCQGRSEQAEQSPQ
jgi:hypothetical protein